MSVHNSTPLISARQSQAQHPAALVYDSPAPIKMSRNHHLNQRSLKTIDQAPMTSMSKVSNLLNSKTGLDN